MPADARPGGRRRVVIVGGGFGGLAAARSLRHADVDVTLVDRRNHHLFQPLLYQAAAGGLSPERLRRPDPARAEAQPNTTVLMAEVTDVDAEHRQVVLDRGDRLDYDSLIVACGGETSYFGHDEWKDVTCGLKTLVDVVDLRKRFFGAFEQAERTDDPAERAEWLTFVVIGGGPTGVEIAGRARDHRTHDEARLPADRRRRRARDRARRRASAWSPRSARSSRRRSPSGLAELGVTVHEGARATAIDERGVTYRDRRSERADRQPGRSSGPPACDAVPLTDVTRPRDRSEHRPRRAHRGQPRPDRAGPSRDLGDRRRRVPRGARRQAASGARDGRHPAGPSRGQGDPRGRARGLDTPFQYFDKGALAVVGKGKAVCEIRGLELWGRPAFFTYLGVHLYYLGGQTGRRLEVLIKWVGARFGERQSALIEGELASVERALPRRGGDSVGADLFPLAADLGAARSQMAFTLGFHIILASLGVAFPAIILIANYLRAARERRGRARARAALVEGGGRAVRGRRGHRHRAARSRWACCGPSSWAGSARSSGPPSRSRASSSSSRRSSWRSTSSAGSACRAGPHFWTGVPIVICGTRRRRSRSSPSTPG